MLVTPAFIRPVAGRNKINATLGHVFNSCVASKFNSFAVLTLFGQSNRVLRKVTEEPF